MFFLYSSIILTGILLSGSQNQDTDNCTMRGTKELCVQREVIGVKGEDVILPCRFNHREGNKIKDLRLVWIEHYNRLIFRSFPKYTRERFKGRIQTVGNPSEGDGTVRIRDLKMEDEGTYKCGFEFTQWTQERNWGWWSRVSFYASDGKQTRLRVDESWSRDTTYCTIQDKMELCAPLEVKGVQGEDVIIPCRFRHNKGNHIKELGLVFKKYYNYKQDVIFNSSSKYTDGGFNGRIQTVGNPSEGDGSVRIRDLKMEDEGTYGCRFEFDQWRYQRWEHVGFEPRSSKRTKVQVDGSQINDRYNCTMEGTKKLCVQRDVIGVRGEDVILPCRFNHDEGDNIKDLSFVLYRYYNSQYNVIFNSSTNDTYGGFKGRIQIVGNPNEGDGSVKIGDLNMEDEGTYVCRFEFYEWRSWWRSWHHVGLRAREGKQTRVRVDVSPKILRIWKEFVNSSTSWRLFCEAKAKPRPSITWKNPQGLLVNGSEMQENTNHQNESQIISSYNITGEDPEGNYSCSVQNQHGTGKGFVWYKEFEKTNEERGITGIVLGCSTALILVLLLLIVFGFLIYKKKRNPAEGTDAHLRMDPNQEEEEVDLTYATLAVLPQQLFPAPEHSPDTSIYAVIKR